MKEYLRSSYLARGSILLSVECYALNSNYAKLTNIKCVSAQSYHEETTVSKLFLQDFIRAKIIDASQIS